MDAGKGGATLRILWGSVQWIKSDQHGSSIWETEEEEYWPRSRDWDCVPSSLLGHETVFSSLALGFPTSEIRKLNQCPWSVTVKAAPKQGPYSSSLVGISFHSCHRWASREAESERTG